MPSHMAALVQEALKEAGRGIKDARIAVLGYSYLEDSDDTRNSPSEALVRILRDLGADPVIHDPWIVEYNGDVMDKVEGCDAAVVMVAHSVYRELDLLKLKSALRLPVLVDGRRIFDRMAVFEAELIYSGVGLA